MKKSNKNNRIIKQNPSHNNNKKTKLKDLVKAVGKQKFETCKELLTGNNIDEIINITDKYKKTLLNDATRTNNYEICELLIKAGADPNIVDTAGYSPLIIAAVKNNYELCELLVKNGAKVTYEDFQDAIKKKDLALCKILVGANNINEADKENKTILDKALSENNYELCKLLIKNGAKVTHEQLRNALNDENLELCEILIAADNIDEIINKTDEENKTILDIALSENNYELCKLLIKNGAKVTHEQLRNAVNDENLELCEILIAADNIDEIINSSKNHSSTILFNTARKGNYEFCKLLIEAGADVNNTDNHNNKTPLAIAAENNNYKLCELLVKNGADANISTDNHNPLKIAIRNKNYDLCELLVKSGAKSDNKQLYSLQEKENASNYNVLPVKASHTTDDIESQFDNFGVTIIGNTDNDNT